MADGCYGEEDWVDPGYDTSTIAKGFYIFVMKGCLSTRLRTIGVAAPGQAHLTANQIALRAVAKVQASYFTTGDDWRRVTTPTGAFCWGPERPDFAGGAIVFLSPRDCPKIEQWCRTGVAWLQSKHTVVSSEYMPLFGNTLSESDLSVPPGPKNSRVKFMARQACMIENVSWFRSPEYH